MKMGFLLQVLISSTGNSYVDGTKFEKNIYCLWLLSQMRNMIFTFTGNHNGTTKVANPLSDYLKYGSNGEPNIKYNSGWG
jgi:hypothetical protein